MTTDRDDASMRRYREASAALDERPSAATHAAILAAAARQVEARPQSADTPRGVRRPRWPLAAAAAVLLSTLAVMVATRTEQEMPSFTAPAERASETLAAAPAPASSTVPSPAADGAAPAPPSAREQAPPQAPKKSGPANARDEGSLVAPNVQVDAQRSKAANAVASAPPPDRVPEAASAESAQAFGATAPPAARPPAAPLARSAPGPLAGARRAPDVSAAARLERPSADGAATQAAAPVPHTGARLDTAREFERSASAWLEQIVRLRGAGHDAEADAELKRLRERYPDAQVPPAALSGGTAAGTR